MTKSKKILRDSPEWELHAGAVIEEMKDMMQIVMEQTADIPVMKEQIAHMLTWEDKINLIPAIFEEVGKLRHDVTILQEAVQLIGYDNQTIQRLEKRIVQLENDVHALRAEQR